MARLWLNRLSLFTALARVAVSVGPVVNLTYSTYEGTALANGISQWLGMRYAAPPLGDLRFQPPVEPLSLDILQPAKERRPHCLATGASPNDTTTSEDCLFINVFAPSAATPESKLPVFLFIQGGGFNSNSNPYVNGSSLIAAGNHSLIVVTFNYRVGPYGFLVHGPRVVPNIGLHDQLQALQWVHRHIVQFGGDASHVVLGGASAGAASISIHLTAPGGRNTGLFIGAAAESPSFATTLTASEAQYQYDNLAVRLACLGTEDQSLACLRRKPAREIQEWNTRVPFPGAETAPTFMWGPVIDGDLVSELTYDAFAKGEALRVPLIVGDDANGGSVFAPKAASTAPEVNRFLRAQYPGLSLEMLARVEDLYPNTNQSCPDHGCRWRQASDIYGDMRYTCPGLFMNSAVSTRRLPFASQSWAYLWKVEDPALMEAGYGVPHTIEVYGIFGPESAGPGAPASYLPGQLNYPAVEAVQAYWASFIRTLDPNTYKLESAANWAPWTDDGQQRMEFGTGGTTSSQRVDEVFMRKCAYFAQIAATIKQ